jgi:hypothetical protein
MHCVGCRPRGLLAFKLLLSNHRRTFCTVWCTSHTTCGASVHNVLPPAFCPCLLGYSSSCGGSDAEVCWLPAAPSPAGSNCSFPSRAASPDPAASGAEPAAAGASQAAAGSAGSSARGGGGSGQLSGRSARSKAYRLDAGKYLQLAAKQKGQATGMLDTSVIGLEALTQQEGWGLSRGRAAASGGSGGGSVRGQYQGTLETLPAAATVAPGG